MFNSIKKWIAETAATTLVKFVLDLIIDLILKRLQKYADNLDWKLVREDVNKLIRSKIPSSFLQDICILIAKAVMDIVEQIFADVVSCEKIKAALRAGDFKKAKKLVWEYLKACIM